MTVFPIGHYLGPFFPAKGAPMECHQIRVGQSVTNLFSQEEFAVWALAHGLPGMTVGSQWTPEALAALVRERGGDDVTGLVAELIQSGVLVEVSPGPDALAFARGHRLQALLVGLGTTVARPDQFLLGFTGQPFATVDELAFELWQWGPLHPDLWTACEALAATDTVTTGRPTSPEELLTSVLDGLHTLLSNGAAYLDVVG